MDRLDRDLGLWQSVLEAMTIIMFQSRYNNLKIMTLMIIKGLYE